MSLTTMMALAMGVDLPRWSTVMMSSGSDTRDSWVSWQLISPVLLVPVPVNCRFILFVQSLSGYQSSAMMT